jgi:hypothetical protein
VLNNLELLELAGIISIVMFLGLILLYVFILKNVINASDTPYQKALSHELAVEEIGKKSGIQFKKEVVEAFFRIANMKGR